MQYNLIKLQKKLKKELDEDRYRHTLGVMYTSAALAMRYDISLLEQAQVAGLLHDCAKCIPNEKKLRMCEKNGIEINEAERSAPSLLHAKLGACLARERYGIEEEQILDAIRYHTTGRPKMSMLEMIVFEADYIEPGRWKASGLEEIRTLAFENLDLAVYHTLKDTLRYLHRSDAQIDDMTARAFDYYEALIGGN